MEENLGYDFLFKKARIIELEVRNNILQTINFMTRNKDAAAEPAAVYVGDFRCHLLVVLGFLPSWKHLYAVHAATSLPK